MKQIQFQGEFIGVERINRAEESRYSGPWVSPEVSNNLGVVRFVGHAAPSSLAPTPGTRVYFGGELQQITIQGVEILVMKTTNIVAWEVEADGVQETPNS